MQVLNGRFGPYISFEKANYKIPKDKDAGQLTLAECMEIIEKAGDTKKKTPKKTAPKTSTAKASNSATKKTTKTTKKKSGTEK